MGLPNVDLNDVSLNDDNSDGDDPKKLFMLGTVQLLPWTTARRTIAPSQLTPGQLPPGQLPPRTMARRTISN